MTSTPDVFALLAETRERLSRGPRDPEKQIDDLLSRIDRLLSASHSRVHDRHRELEARLWSIAVDWGKQSDASTREEDAAIRRAAAAAADIKRRHERRHTASADETRVDRAETLRARRAVKGHTRALQKLQRKYSSLIVRGEELIRAMTPIKQDMDRIEHRAFWLLWRSLLLEVAGTGAKACLLVAGFGIAYFANSVTPLFENLGRLLGIASPQTFGITSVFLLESLLLGPMVDGYRRTVFGRFQEATLRSQETIAAEIRALESSLDEMESGIADLLVD